MERNLKHKGFLIILKYIPHITALFYIIYTLLSFAEIDPLILGQLTHVSLFSWLFMFLTSIIFRFCYVHRLPLYYIAVNELLVNIDYYIGIPIEDIKLLLVHLTIIIFLIFGYSYYYIKYKLKKMSFIKTYGRCYLKFPENNSDNKYLGYEYVDLGLPSGRKWATMNLGANSIVDYGLYFQWGDTQGYENSNNEKEFSGNDYKYFDATTGQYTKYNETDNKKILDSEDNAVCTILGGNWKIPSPEDFLELQENTTYSFVFNYQESGVNGVLFTSNVNGNTLFFPAVGQRAYNISGSSAGVLGYYLSDSLYNIIQVCTCMSFNPGSVTFNSSTGRICGCTIRPVF